MALARYRSELSAHMIPMVCMVFRPSPLANALGLYSYWLMTSSTLFLVFSLTLLLPFRTRDTVAMETPAFSDMS